MKNKKKKNLVEKILEEAALNEINDLKNVKPYKKIREEIGEYNAFVSVYEIEQTNYLLKLNLMDIKFNPEVFIMLHIKNLTYNFSFAVYDENNKMINDKSILKNDKIKFTLGQLSRIYATCFELLNHFINTKQPNAVLILAEPGNNFLIKNENYKQLLTNLIFSLSRYDFTSIETEGQKGFVIFKK